MASPCLPCMNRLVEAKGTGGRSEGGGRDEKVVSLLSRRSKERIDTRIRELTPRNWGRSLENCIKQLNVYLLDWVGLFGICTTGIERMLGNLDAHIRRRLRALRACSTAVASESRVRRLETQAGDGSEADGARGARRNRVEQRLRWAQVHLSAEPHSPVDRAMRNAYFAERGLVSLKERWRSNYEPMVVPRQLTLPLG